MKRIMSWMIICLMLFALTACETRTDSPTPPTTPENNTSAVTGTQQPPQGEPETDNRLLNEKAKKNTEVLPRGFDEETVIVGQTTLSALKDKTLTAYLGWEADRFSYQNNKGETIGEGEWLQLLAQKYGAKITLVRKSAPVALAAQRIALRSGKQVDILGFTPDYLPEAVSLTADLTSVLDDKAVQSLHYLNHASALMQNGVRFLSPAGVGAVLWYQTKEDALEDPATLAAAGQWTAEAFSAYCKSATQQTDGKVTRYGFMNSMPQNTLLTALGCPLFYPENQNGTLRWMDGLKNKALGTNLSVLKDLYQATGAVYTEIDAENPPSLAAGTLAMQLAQTPGKKPIERLAFAPLPDKGAANSVGVVGASAPVLALPRGEKVDESALALALTWTARYADAHHDTLRFDCQLSYAQWQALYEMSSTLWQYSAGESRLEEGGKINVAEWMGTILDGSMDVTTAANNMYPLFARQIKNMNLYLS